MLLLCLEVLAWMGGGREDRDNQIKTDVSQLTIPNVTLDSSLKLWTLMSSGLGIPCRLEVMAAPQNVHDRYTWDKRFQL